MPLLPVILSTIAEEEKTRHSPVLYIRSTNFAQGLSLSENKTNNTDIVYLTLRS